MAKPRFKAGDKVKVRSLESLKKEFGTDCTGAIPMDCSFVKPMFRYCGKEVVIEEVFSSSGDNIYTIEGDTWNFNEKVFEIPNQSIVIYRKDNKVYAVNKATGETGVAICCPEDEFDFKIGADIAYERLMGRKEPPKEREPKEKFYNAEVVCVDDSGKYFEKGKIYKVKNGIIYDRYGKPDRYRFKSLKELNNWYISQFIEVKR